MRAPSFEKLCDMIIIAMNHVSQDIVTKSFIQTGQTKDSRPDEITFMKEGRGLHHVLPELKKIWDQDQLESDELIFDLVTWKKKTAMP